MSESNSCSFKDPETDEACPFDPRHNLEFEGRSYCILHLPLPPEKKIARIGIHVDTLRNLFAIAVSKAKAQGKTTRLRGVHFPFDLLDHFDGHQDVDLDVSWSVIYTKVNFGKNRTVVKNLKMVGVEFRDDCHFTDKVTFSGDLDTSDATFFSSLQMDSAFLGDVVLMGARYCGSIQFQTTCKGAENSITFDSNTFESISSFTEQFSCKTTIFKKCIFRKPLVFSAKANVVANAKVEFFQCTANDELKLNSIENVLFDNCSIAKSDVPSNAILHLVGNCQSVTIKNCRIDKIALRPQLFIASLRIGNNSTIGDLVGRNIRIDSLLASECSFLDAINLPDSEVWLSKIIQCNVQGAVNLENSEFREMVLQGSSFARTFSMQYRKSSGDKSPDLISLDISECKLAAFDMQHRSIESILSISRTTFASAPDFRNCMVSGSASFSTDYGSYSCNESYASASYRRMKHQMEDGRHRVAQGMFHALEQRSDKRQLSARNADWWISGCYELFSNYGFSFVRPILWIGITFFCFSLIYACEFSQSCLAIGAPVDWTSLGNGVLAATKQIFVPFYELRNADQLKGIHFLYLAQSLLTIIFTTLAILAVRWRFRRD